MVNTSKAMVSSRAMEASNMDSHKEGIMRRDRRWVINSNSNILRKECTGNNLMDTDNREDIMEIRGVVKLDS
jgi:hypothetical protein